MSEGIHYSTTYSVIKSAIQNFHLNTLNKDYVFQQPLFSSYSDCLSTVSTGQPLIFST